MAQLGSPQDPPSSSSTIPQQQKPLASSTSFLRRSILQAQNLTAQNLLLQKRLWFCVTMTSSGGRNPVNVISRALAHPPSDVSALARPKTNKKPHVKHTKHCREGRFVSRSPNSQRAKQIMHFELPPISALCYDPLVASGRDSAFPVGNEWLRRRCPQTMSRGPDW